MNFRIAFSSVITTFCATSFLVAYAADHPNDPYFPDGRGPQGACVTADTKVLLADGTSKEIGKILPTDQVMNTKGDSVSVVKIVGGPEKPLMYVVTTDSGRTVSATQGHPFVTSRGSFILSKELTIGSKLKTIDGLETVTRIEREAYSGIVYNLYLGSSALVEEYNEEFLSTKASYDWRKELIRQKPFAGLEDEQHTLYVNGFESGDKLLQMAFVNGR